MAPRTRRRQLFVINRRWSVGLAAAVLLVAAGIVGILAVQAGQLSRPWTYLFLAVALVGAVSAIALTIVRANAGDQIDESDL